MQNPDGSVDVNGDGKSNGVFMGSQNIGLYDITTQRKRQACNASFQVDLDHGLTLTSDYFYAHQDQYDRNVGIQFNSTNWQGATYVPLQSRDTGSTALSQYNTPTDPSRGLGRFAHLHHPGVPKMAGRCRIVLAGHAPESTAQNFNLQLDFNNGGPFQGSVRGIRETAQPAVHRDRHQYFRFRRLPVGGPRQRAALRDLSSILIELGGNRVFNPNGIPQNTMPVTADFRGRNLDDQHAPDARQHFRQPQRLGDEDAGIRRRLRPQGRDSPRCASMDTTISVMASTLNFGVRNGIRAAHNDGFTLVAPVYAGMGASDPNGCLVRYVGADVILSGNGLTAPPGVRRATRTEPSAPAPCRRSRFRIPRRRLPTTGSNTTTCSGRGSTSGRSIRTPWTIPRRSGSRSIRDTIRQASPGTTWAVWLKETTGYLQADFSGTLGSMPYSGNVGVRVIHTNLNVTQHLTGDPGQYGTEPADAGADVTRRSYNDVLPAAQLRAECDRQD